LLAVLSLLVLQPAAADAGTIPIEVVSQWYSTHGLEDYNDPGSSFDVSGTSSVYSPSGRHWATGSFSGTELDLDANASFWAEWATSEVSMVFRPVASGLVDVLVYMYDSGVANPMVKLQDTSTGEWLLDYPDVWTFCGDFSYECLRSVPLSFTAGHDYALTLVAVGHHDDARARVTMPFTTVPDPGSTLLLLGLGLAGLAWRRRRE